MANTTKRQHFIWRKYLKKWLVNDKDKKLYVLRKKLHGKQEAIEYCKLEDIGFEKYYYDMTGFSNESVTILTQLLEYMQEGQSYQITVDHTVLKDASTQRDFMERNIICVAEDIDNKYNFLEKLANKNYSFYEDSKIQKTYNQLQSFMYENLFGADIELSDAEFAKILYDLKSSLDDIDLKYEFNQFFWMQYYRTPRILERLKANITEAKVQKDAFKNLDVDFFANMLAVYYAVQTSLNLTQNFATNIYLLENNTGVPFITCDTPIINLTGMEMDKKTLFYYPITPNIAMQMAVMPKLSYMATQSRNHCIRLEQNAVNTVNELNKKLALKCRSEIYSNDKNYLETIEKYVNLYKNN